ncbi:MAG: gfo/Idh/MocA family oxidoreductase, partial [Chloroflexi bacterium]|nr:gfo/Idh/MocA family oxidoreductase [Chloroflexota bacterium]
FRIRVGDLLIPTMQFGEPLFNECKHFIECVQTGRRPITDGWNGLQVVKVLEAAERSLRQGGVPLDL